MCYERKYVQRKRVDGWRSLISTKHHQRKHEWINGRCSIRQLLKYGKVSQLNYGWIDYFINGWLIII
jgi:hypothetical protein